MLGLSGIILGLVWFKFRISVRRGWEDWWVVGSLFFNIYFGSYFYIRFKRYIGFYCVIDCDSKRKKRGEE